MRYTSITCALRIALLFGASVLFSIDSVAWRDASAAGMAATAPPKPAYRRPLPEPLPKPLPGPKLKPPEPRFPPASETIGTKTVLPTAAEVIIGFDLQKLKVETAEARYKDLVRRNIPGGEPELVILLDRTNAFGAVRGMEQAWGERPVVDMVKANVTGEEIFSQMSGKTVIMVGHIEKDSYVVKFADGNERSYLIKDLRDQAAKYRVLLFPIGCNSYLAGAPFGHSRIITTEEVSTFLAQVPHSPTVRDIFSALELIRNFRLDINFTGQWLEATFKDPFDPDANVTVRLEENTLGAPSYGYNPTNNTAAATVGDFTVTLVPARSIDGWLTPVALSVSLAGAAAPSVLRTQWFRRSYRRLKIAGTLLPLLLPLRNICLFLLKAAVIIAGLGIFLVLLVFPPFTALVVILLFGWSLAMNLEERNNSE